MAGLKYRNKYKHVVLSEGVHYIPKIKKYIVRIKIESIDKNGKNYTAIKTICLFVEKKDAENKYESLKNT